jgi:predicted DNA-binding transcriptional regulator YafY
MTSISVAGIPVCSSGGKYGGYSIIPSYKIKNITIGNDEQQMIIRALESLATSYTNDTLRALIEKYNTIIEKKGGRKVFWDFGVTKENQSVQTVNRELEQAIALHRFIADEEETGLMQEYFPDCPIEHLEEKMCRIFIDVPEKERLWKALLLSFGDRVSVAAPEYYRNELVQTARKFLSKNT